MLLIYRILASEKNGHFGVSDAMEKKEILQRIDSQLWAAPEAPYSKVGRWFWYDLKAKESKSLSIIWGGRVSLESGTEVKRKSYPYCCISYLLSGHGTLKIHGQKHKLEPGTISGHCPGVPHHYSYSTDMPAEHIFIVFTGKEALELMEKSSLAKLGAISVTHSEDTLRSILYILKHSIDKTENSQIICSSHLRIILLSLADHIAQSSKHISKAERTYHQCRKFVDDNFIEISSASDFANRSGWNAIYISRLFKKFDNISLKQYIMRLKLARAASFLLEEDEMPIGEIALKLGFSDRYYFSKKFKKFYGLSPNQYRKTHLQH